MARSRSRARDAGTEHETRVARYLAEQLDDDRIERRSRNGAKDRGDVAGVRHLGQRVVVECKEYGGQYKVGPWLAEAEIERRNDDAGVGLVVAKRRGTTRPGEQVVFMTLTDLVSLMAGERPA